MIRQIFTTMFFGTFILSTSRCTLVAEDPPVQQGPLDLPYAEESQIAFEQALHDGQGEYDVGISAAVMVSGYKPWVGVSGNSRPGVAVKPDMLFNMGALRSPSRLLLRFEHGKLDPRGWRNPGLN